MTQPDPGAQSGAGTGQSDGGTGTPTDPASNGGTQSGAPAGDGGQQQGQQTGMTLEQALQALEDQRRRTTAADQNQAKLQAELKKFQDAQLSAEEKTKRDLEEAVKAREQAEREARDLKLRVAFLSDTTFTWRNPEHALRLLDLNGVELKEDGSIVGLKEAIKKLAEGDGKYMLKPTDGSEEGDGGAGKPPPPAGSTVPMTGGQSGGKGNNLAEDAKRFPALRTRGLGT